MIPQYFIELQSLPYNYNGKIDKKALPNPEVSTNKDVIPPRNIIDEKLTKIFKEILNVNVISIEDSFFELGGDSLEAINLCSKIYSEFGVEVFVKNIYECSIVRELSDFISLSDVKKNAKISKTEERDFYPLSSAQQRIYYATSMAGDSSLLYNISGGLILDKLPDLVKLQKSFDDVISMQPSLRTCFVLHGNDVVQKINKKINFKLDVNEEVIDENRLDFIFDDFVKPFDLSHAPLFRAKIYKLSSGKVLLAIDTHHIISDGASLSALIKDICKSYNGQSLTKLQLDYKDYTVWENNNLNSGKFNEAEAYWLNQFKYDVPLLNLPTKPRETTSSYDGNVINMRLNKFQVQKIVDLSKKLEVTPYMLMLTAYYILLYKYTSQNDIVVGTPIVNRNTSELYDIIGMFVNSLPMRINIDGELRFKELLTNIKELSLENYKYQYYPFDQLVKKLKITRAVNRNPLFDTMFIYQNNGYADVTLDGINAKYYIPKSKISKFDLSLEVLPIDEEMKLSFEYKKALFSEDFITKLSCHYAKILDTVLDNVNIKIAKINMLSNTERNQIIDEFNNTKTVYPLNKTIIKLFDEQVVKTPNNIAISFEDKTLTFAKLSELASKYAFYLKNNGVIEKDVVAIMCKRSIYLPAYILAVLKLGAAYLLIDPSLPKERIQYMINNCKAKKLIVDNEYDIKFSSFVFVNEMNKETVLLNNHQLNTVPTDVFAIIYTSGSTGMPKGVMLTNQGFVNLVYSFCDIMDIHTFKNQIGLASVSFDMFAVELFSCVLLGRTLYLLNEEELKNPMLISKKIINNNIEFIITTPTKIDLLTSTEEISTCLKHIKALQLGGEILTTALVEKLRYYTDAKIYNGYGPTEISACCSNKYIEHDNVINIGKPNPNVHIYIVDKDQNLCPIGVPGQLCVSGLGLSAGYVNAPEKTVLSFVKSNFNDEILYKTGDIAKYTENGELEYIGRNDFQIKINGLRIEISEVETQLAAVKEIKSCVVLPDNSKKYLKAFYVSDENLHVPNIKKSLAEKLPYYMIPKYIFKLDSIPMTTNGKIDVTFLRNYKESECNSNVSYVAPETDLQKNLCQIWSNILDSKVGIDNDVFELGADSLLAIRFKVQALNINIDIPYADIFKYKTVRELSSSIEGSIRNKTPIEKYDYTQINNVLKENKIKLNYKINFCRNNNVLLLGSNGFVGMHIIDSFIRQDTGKIYCLMRKKNGEEANSRFMNVLHFYFGENLDKEVGNRIIIVEGDATKDDFGLNKTDYQSVIENVSVVINSAANVKHYGDFDKFKDINIGAISKAILFCRQHSKRFIHLSTLSISGNMFLDGTVSNNSSSSKIYFSEKDLYINQTLDNIYTRSKFAAERIILDEISNGLDALILRLGNITSRFSDGKFQFNPGENAFAVRFQSFLAVGAIPKSLLRQEIEFTPVDLCANAIVKCIQNREKDISVLHIYDKKHVKVNKIYKVLKNMGFNIKILSNQDFSKFIQKSLNDSIMQNNLMGLINDITKDKTISYASNIRIKSKFTIHFLLHCKFKWPKLNKKYIEKYIIYLRKINFINF